MSETCRSCGGEIHYEFDTDPATGEWLHSRIDDGSHEAHPTESYDPRVVCPVHVNGNGHNCGMPCRFVAHYGAPGIGSHYVCAEGHDVTKIGAFTYDPADGPHELSEWDVI